MCARTLLEQTDKQTNTQTYRQTDRDRQTDSQTYAHTHTHTHARTHAHAHAHKLLLEYMTVRIDNLQNISSSFKFIQLAPCSPRPYPGQLLPACFFNRQTDRQTNRQTGKQTDRRTDRQTNRQPPYCASSSSACSKSVRVHNLGSTQPLKAHHMLSVFVEGPEIVYAHIL